MFYVNDQFGTWIFQEYNCPQKLTGLFKSNDDGIG
jgi:hypothetical protein